MVTKERATEILKIYNDGKKDLFNWCEEYKEFINNSVHACVSYEIDYILKKSFEDNDTPLSYDEIDLFDSDKAKDIILYKYDESEEDFINYSNDENTFNRKVKNKDDFEVFLNSLNDDELKELMNNFNIDEYECQIEIYEWWIISDPLKYRLEQKGEIILNDKFWGRCTTGQSISLDYCCITAFIDLLEDRIRF